MESFIVNTLKYEKMDSFLNLFCANVMEDIRTMVAKNGGNLNTIDFGDFDLFAEQSKKIRLNLDRVFFVESEGECFTVTEC